MGKESNNFSNHPLSQDLSECEMDTFKKDKRSYSHNVGKKNRTSNTENHWFKQQWQKWWEEERRKMR
jgi:hypothetical protein